jgi:hypothetical protein
MGGVTTKWTSPANLITEVTVETVVILTAVAVTAVILLATLRPAPAPTPRESGSESDLEARLSRLEGEAERLTEAMAVKAAADTVVRRRLRRLEELL